MSEAGEDDVAQAIRQFRAIVDPSADEQAAALYPILKRIKGAHVIDYRCTDKKACLLLHVVQAPGGLITYQKPYKNSREKNELTSNEAGRRANTLDGDRRWKEQTHFRNPSTSHVLTCHHVSDVPLSSAELDFDIGEGHAHMRVKPDGSRYAR